MTISPRAQKLDEVRAKFEADGLSVSDWAMTHGFKRASVYAVLDGRSRCRRGEGHRIAVALGLKIPSGEVAGHINAISNMRRAANTPGASSAPTTQSTTCEGAMT